MSYIFLKGDWSIYREDCRPEFSHVYHSQCQFGPKLAGEYMPIVEDTERCGYCGKKAPKKVLRLLQKIRQGEEDEMES